MFGCAASTSTTTPVNPYVPVSLASLSVPSATIGVAYSAAILANDGTAPYSFTVTSGSLPAGITLASTGVLLGMPSSSAVTSSFVVTVTDATGTKASATISLNVGAGVLTPVSIVTNSLPAGTVGTAYSATVLAVNGTTPYSFTVSAGSLPAGLSLSTAGALSGTPTTAGTYNFTVKVTDAKSGTATASFSVTVGAAALPVSITTATLPSGVVGTVYSATVAAVNGTTPYSFTLTSGSLPAGLSLATSGALTGTPTTAATSTFTVTVTDAKAQTASATYSVTIGAATVPVSITTATLPSGVAGTAYGATIAASNGTTPYSFAVTTGSLPAGLALATSGAISGTPTTKGSSTFTVTVTDAKSGTATANYTLTIAPSPIPVSITTATLPNGTVSSVYSAMVVAANGATPYSFAVTAGALPAGVTLAPGGGLSGTPTTAGPANFTITVTDNNGQKASASYTVTISTAVTPVSITTGTLPVGIVGTPYSALVVAASGTAPYSFAVTSGSLPVGVTLGANGGLTGTPTTPGPANFTISVTDTLGGTASKSYSVTVAAAGTAISLAPTSLPAGTVGVAYTSTIAATGGTAPYNFTVTGGQLPASTTLSSTGTLYGTPITPATSYFTVTVTDAASNVAIAAIGVVMNPGSPATVSVTTTDLPTALLNTTYTTHVVAIGGTAPYTMTIIGGGLPGGLTLSSDGTISGVVTAAGTYYFTVGLSDSSTPAQTTSANLEIVASNYSATVAVDTTHVLTTVPANFYGLHTSVYDTSLNDTGALPTLLAGTGITTLRYPGGGYSDNYHWANFSITPYFSSTAPACNVQADGYLASDGDFGTFVKLLRASGTQGLITVNYGTSVADANLSKTYGTDGQKTCSEPNTFGQPQEAAAWVAYANGSASSTQVIGKDATGYDWKTVGFWASLRAASPLSTDDGFNFLRIGVSTPVGVKFWEIGNEMYYNGWATNHNAETDDHAPYVYPGGYSPGAYNTRNAVAALSPTAYGTNAIAWIQAMKAVDPTIQIGVDFSSPIATDPIPLNWNPDLAKAVCAGTPFDFAIMHYYPGTWKAVQASELLSLPQNDIPFVYAGIEADLAQYCPASAATTQVFLSETSPNGALATGFPQPALGLFTLNDYLTALKTGIANLDWLEMHDGTYLNESEVPGPSYYGIKLAHLLAAPGDSVLSTNISSPLVLSWATTKTNGHHGILLVNADPDNPAVVQVSFNATLGTSATEYTYGVGTVQSGGTLSGSAASISGSTFTVTVNSYTAVELDIP
jgi:hypothetical protein